MRHFSKEEIERTSPEILYLSFAAELDPQTIEDQDDLLIFGVTPEAMVLCAGYALPEDVQEIAIRALYWRKEQLLKMRQAQFN